MRSSRVELYKVKRTREIWFPSRRLTHDRRTTWFTWDHVLFSPSLSLPSSLFLYLSTEARLVSLTLVAKDSLPFLLRFLQESQKLFVRQISSFFSFFFLSLLFLRWRLLLEATPEKIEHDYDVRLNRCSHCWIFMNVNEYIARVYELHKECLRYELSFCMYVNNKFYHFCHCSCVCISLY